MRETCIQNWRDGGASGALAEGGAPAEGGVGMTEREKKKKKRNAKKNAKGLIACGQTMEEAEVLEALLKVSGLLTSHVEDDHELCYKRRQLAQTESGLPSHGQRVFVLSEGNDKQPATILDADSASGLCVVVYDTGE